MKKKTPILDVEIPDGYICPLSLEPMLDPVYTCDGFVYERAQIELWLKDHSRSPMTNLELPNKNLTPHTALKQEIDAWLEKHSEQAQNHVQAELFPKGAVKRPKGRPER